MNINKLTKGELLYIFNRFMKFNYKETFIEYLKSYCAIESQYTTQSELVALNDFTGNKSSINGSFFLCVGGISGSSSDTYNVKYTPPISIMTSNASLAYVIINCNIIMFNV